MRLMGARYGDSQRGTTIKYPGQRPHCFQANGAFVHALPCALTSGRQEQQPDPGGRCGVGWGEVGGGGGRWGEAARSPQIWLSHQRQQTLIANSYVSKKEVPNESYTVCCTSNL